MARAITTDLCVIGAGSAGLAVAAGAVQMGAEVVLIEKGRMGGDCLNYGCVPSKSLIAAGKAAQTVRTAARFGVNGHEPAIDFQAVHDHVKGVIAAIAPHDLEERFAGLGVKVVRAPARFVGPREVAAGEARITARRFVVATGSSPALPPVPGLAEAPHLTNETVFDLTERPEHLIVLGGGPIGCELAQAQRRLGARVTLLELFTILPKDDPAAVEVVRRQLVAEGIDLREQVAVTGVEREGNGVAITLEQAGVQERLTGSHLLVAAGRRANVEGLGLAAAGVEHSPKGIKVDARLRTTNRRIYAIGDVAGGLQFTHVAGYHAGIVIRNALFRLPAKVDTSAVPWVTYTEPELAQVGLERSCREGARPRGRGPDLAVRRQRPGAGRARDRGIRQGAGRPPRPHSRRDDRRRARRRADPAVGAGDQHRPQDRQHGAVRGTLPHARRGLQARRGQPLHAEAVQRAHQEDRPLAAASALTPRGIDHGQPFRRRGPTVEPLAAPPVAAGGPRAGDRRGLRPRPRSPPDLRGAARASRGADRAGRRPPAARGAGFVLVYATVIALSVPGGAVLTIAGGFMFGSVFGTLLVVVAATLGATAGLPDRQERARRSLRARAGPFLKRMEAGFQQDALNYLLVLRLIPLFPFWIVNLVPAFLGVPLRTYVLGTFLGIIPGSFVFASVGAGLGSVLDSGQEFSPASVLTPQIVIALVGLAVLALLPVAYRKWRSRRG